MSASERRQSVRTGVVWNVVSDLLGTAGTGGAAPARIVDVGGGTGGFAVPLAELGHKVLVIDPSPDALAALDRRARERGVADLVRGQQGDLSDVTDLVSEVDLVLCHGVLDVVEDPAAGLARAAEALRPGGHLSLLVGQRHAAVLARAMAGQFAQAQALLDPDAEPGRSGRRFTHDEITALLLGAGFTVEQVHGVRVFADLVPGALLDAEAGSTQALVDLERAVAGRPEFFPLAAQLHLLAVR